MTRSLLGVRATAVVAAASCIVVASGCGDASERTEDEVVQWVRETAIPLTPVTATTPDEPLADGADLERVDELVDGATVVGLGESAHGLGDQFVLRQRMARRLVEDHGFRTTAFEEDYGSGVAIDRYVTEGTGDPRELVGSMVSAWRTEQMLEFVAWMRDFNDHHQDDPVRFLGTVRESPGRRRCS